MRLLLAMAWLAIGPLPVLAQTPNQECQQTVDGFVAVAKSFNAEVGALDGTAVAEGWCRVTATDGALRGGVFAQARFRLDRLDAVQPGSRSLEIDLDGVQTVFGRFDVTAALSHAPDSGLLTVHSALARGTDGRGLQALGRLDMPAFKTVPDAQNAVAELRLITLSVQAMITPDLLQDAGADFSDVTRVAVDDALEGVSLSQVSTKTRNEFLRFAGAAPNARGTLDVGLDAPDSLGVLQLVMPFVTLGNRPDAQALAQALAVSLTGVVLDVAWKPGRM